MAWPLAFRQALRLTALCTQKRRSSRLRGNLHLHFRYNYILSVYNIRQSQFLQSVRKIGISSASGP